MYPRKKRVLCIAAIFLLTSNACSSENMSANPVLPTFIAPSGQTESSPAAGSCDNELLPVKQGASWNYYSTGGPNGDFSYIDTITATHSDGFTLTSQFPTITLNQAWFCAADGLVAQQLGGGTTASISMQNMISDFTTLNVEGLSLPRTVISGMQWQYTLAMEGSVAMPGENTKSPGTFTLIMQEIGSELITIPAGTFEAKKIHATFNAQINVDFQGSLVPYTVNGSSIIWYAPGIGFIKSIENIDFSGTQFTSTTELQTFNIP